MSSRGQSWLGLGVILAGIAAVAIATLKPESFDETRRLLRDGQQYTAPLSGIKPLCEDPAIERILAAPGCAQYLAQLADLPPEKRIAVLDADMTSLVDAYIVANETALAHNADPTKPSNKTSFPALKYNMATVLFAAAHLTDEATLTSLLKKSEALTDRITKRCREPDVPEMFRRQALRNVGPSRDDLVDLVVHCHERTGGFTQVASVAIPADIVTTVPLVPWSALSDLFEPPPRRGGGYSIDASRSGEPVKIHRFCATASTPEERERNEQFFQQFDEALPEVNVEANFPERSNVLRTK